MLLTELMSGPITVDGIALDAMEHLDSWLGNYDPDRLAAEIPRRLAGFLKKHPRYANPADRKFMSDNLMKIGQQVYKYIMKQKK